MHGIEVPEQKLAAFPYFMTSTPRPATGRWPYIRTFRAVHLAIAYVRLVCAATVGSTTGICTVH
jgi:hypothetical protein